jgi:hypothetical protein
MSLHVDLATHRTAPFSPEMAGRLERWARAFAQAGLPAGHSARISLDRSAGRAR